jgi:hypothetical protein
MTGTDLDLVRPLAEGRIRVALARQVAEWSGETEDAVRPHLDRLASPDVGWLEKRFFSEEWPAGKFALTRPIAVREPGEPVPDLKAVLHKIMSRRVLAPRRALDAEMIMGFRATRKLVDHIGGVMPHGSQTGFYAHLAVVTDMYLAVRRDRPHLAASWRVEGAYRAAHPGLGDLAPDAVAIDADGSPRAFKYGGSRTDQAWRRPDWPEVFNRTCEELGIFAWEIW